MAEQASGPELAPGWMRDPSGRHFGRYWDGKRWTDHVISAETVPTIDPLLQGNHERERTLPSPSIQERRGSWESDPSGRHSSRYWDGRQWTEHVMSAERVPGIDVLQGRPAPPPTAPSPTVFTPTSTAREGVRSAPWAIAIIACGLVIIGIAVFGRSPGTTKGATNGTEPVATTALSVAPPATEIPLATQAPATVPAAPAGAGAPPAPTAVSAPGTVPGDQSPPTSSSSVDSPPTVPRPGQSTSDPSMSTTS